MSIKQNINSNGSNDNRQGRRGRTRCLTSLLSLLSLLMLIVAVITACTSRTNYFAYRAIPVYGWESTEPLEFVMDSASHSATIDIDVCIRTNSEYPFQTLWLLVEQQWDSPSHTETDTVECRISDSRGERRARGVSLYQQSYRVGTFTPGVGRRGIIKVSHLMRRENLPGVTDVGIKIADKNMQ